LNPSYIFDSHALLAFFQNEDGADVVEDILTKAVKRRAEKFLCIINLGEIIYMTKRRFGDVKKIEILGRIQALGFKVVSVSDTMVYTAAEIKAEYAISYADCFAVACALAYSATIVTGDLEFKKITDLAPVEWIR
jgi:ribonuclease VapC